MQLSSIARAGGLSVAMAASAAALGGCFEHRGAIFLLRDRSTTPSFQPLDQGSISGVTCRPDSSPLNVRLETVNPSGDAPISRLWVGLREPAYVLARAGACSSNERIENFNLGAPIEIQPNDSGVTGAYINLTDSLPAGMTHCVGVVPAPLCGGRNNINAVTVNL